MTYKTDIINQVVTNDFRKLNEKIKVKVNNFSINY